jgi:hypothetical protein
LTQIVHHLGSLSASSIIRCGKSWRSPQTSSHQDHISRAT